MTRKEIHEALAKEMKLDHIDEESRLHDPRYVVTLCGSLVSVSQQGYVGLAHLSVKDYLLSNDIQESKHASYFAMSLAESKRELAIWCLSYLSMATLSSGPVSSRCDYVERLENHPFLKHASICWAYYVLAAEECPQLKNLVLKFFNPSSRNAFMSWVQVLNASTSEDWDIYPRHATPLYYAASFGLTTIVSEMVHAGTPLNSPGSRFGGTALHAAVLRNYISVIKILLEAGADARQADFSMTTPLHTAPVRAHTEAIMLLLEYGAEKNAVDCKGDTPLDWAINANESVSIDILRGKSMKSKRADEKVEEVWQSTVRFCPGFDATRRSGMQSSFIVNVE